MGHDEREDGVDGEGCDDETLDDVERTAQLAAVAAQARTRDEDRQRGRAGEKQREASRAGQGERPHH